MSEASEDTRRITAALKALVDDRDPQQFRSAIMVTLEGLVTATLLAAMQGDTRKAVGMLNEGLTPRVEERLALFEHQQRTRKAKQ